MFNFTFTNSTFKLVSLGIFQQNKHQLLYNFPAIERLYIRWLYTSRVSIEDHQRLLNLKFARLEIDKDIKHNRFVACNLVTSRTIFNTAIPTSASTNCNGINLHHCNFTSASLDHNFIDFMRYTLHITVFHLFI